MMKLKKFPFIHYVQSFRCPTAFLLFVIFALEAFPGNAQQIPTHYKFCLGCDVSSKGTIKITPDTKYSDSIGYGFDFNSEVYKVKLSGNQKLNRFITANHPFYFSVKVPEGNYKVTVTLGDVNGTSLTTMRAESRRLFLNHQLTKNKQVKKFSFMVNVRKPDIKTGGKVQLKPREIGKYDWDDKLTLEFSDEHPCVSGIEITGVNNQITIYLAGNSTVVDQDDEPWASWGQMIPFLFKPGVVIANHAESGLTAGSFISSRRLDKVLSLIKPGDYFFMEFGHNDQKEVGPNDGAYKSYTERLNMMINQVRAKQAIPVIVTSTSRRMFNDSGKVVNTLGDYPNAARRLARDQHVAMIDLNAMSAIFYESLGAEGSKKAFVWYPAGTWPGQKSDLQDNTHFNTYGAYELARCVAEGIKKNHLGIKKFLKDKRRFDPAVPDDPDTFQLTLSPTTSFRKPDGN